MWAFSKNNNNQRLPYNHVECGTNKFELHTIELNMTVRKKQLEEKIVCQAIFSILLLNHSTAIALNTHTHIQSYTRINKYIHTHTLMNGILFSFHSTIKPGIEALKRHFFPYMLRISYLMILIHFLCFKALSLTIYFHLRLSLTHTHTRARKNWSANVHLMMRHHHIDRIWYLKFLLLENAGRERTCICVCEKKERNRASERASKQE